MRISNGVILRAVIGALEDHILPHVQTPHAAQQGKYVLSLLSLMRSREHGAFLTEAIQENSASLGKIHDLIGDTGGYPTAEPAGGFDLQQFLPEHATFFQQEADLCQATLELIERRDQGKAQGANGVLDEIGNSRLKLAELQLSFQNSSENDNGSEVSQVPSATELQDYFSRNVPALAGGIVKELSTAPFSLGKQITFIDLDLPNGSSERLVMRQEKPVRIYEGGDSTIIRDEFQVISAACTLGLPVPKLIHLDASGSPWPSFMLMQRVIGEPIGEVFRAFEPLSEDMIMQIAELMATLHGAGLEPFADYLRATDRGDYLSMNRRDATYARICEWERQCSVATQFPNPAKIWLYDWLKRNIPDSEHAPVYVHGDFGIHNLLAKDGKITACLDWEWSHVGNPIEDIAYMRPHIDQYSSWDRFVQHYSAHGGPTLDLSDQVVKFNACLSNVIFSGLAGQMAWFVENGERNDMASVFGADWYGYEFERTALRSALYG